MKKYFTLTAAMICICASLTAQPRSAGIRTGATGFDVSYQHTLGGSNFIEANAGVDFGYCGSGNAGFKAAVIYNFLFARPAWTDKGTWGLYAGPGIALGYVEDQVMYQQSAGAKLAVNDYGFMFSLVGQIGLEYTFEFPLSLAVDIRPYIGIHANDGLSYKLTDEAKIQHYASKTGFYKNGLMGFIPSISVKYRF